nr:MAK10-like protein [Tanacetum cinerariifolium]
MEYYCSDGSLRDRIICDLNKTPDLFQEPSQNCPKCGNPVDGQYCQGCALLRKKFKEDMFTYCIENEIFQDFQDTSEPSNDNTNVVNAPQEPFVVKQDPGKNSSQSPPYINYHCCYGCGDPLEDIFCHQCTCELCRKGAHYGYNCPPKVPIIPNPGPCNNQTIDELPQTLLSFDPTCYSEDGNSFTYDSRSNLVDDYPNVFNPPPQPPPYSYEFCGNDAYYGHDCPLQDCPTVCYNDDDDEDYTIAITPKEPDNSLSMWGEHLDTIPATKSDEFIKSSVENLVPNPSESEGEHGCDVPACDDFTTFSNILFDVDNDFSSSDDQSFLDEDISKKIYSNPLFDKEIISMKIDPHHFNVESDLIESLLNHDSPIISSSSKIDSLFDEFAGELTLLKSIPPEINENDCDHEEEIRLIKRVLYDNSSPRPPKEFISKTFDAAIESFSPSPIPVEDSDSFMEEIDLSFTPDDLMSLGIEEDDYDSERDILILEELLSNNSLSLPENESFHFDIPSSSRPPAKPPDGFDQTQPPQFPVVHSPPQETSIEISHDQENEPDNSLSMGDEHLDTIPVMESDEVIKSSVENLVPILSEFKGIPDTLIHHHIGGPYYLIPCLILFTGKDRKTPQRYPDVLTTSWRISIQSMDSLQGLTPERESFSEAWTRFKDLLQKVHHYGIDLWLQVQIFYDHVNPITRRTIDQSAGDKLRDRNAKESYALLEDLAFYDKSWNDPRDFAKPVKAISLPQDVPSTSDRRLIELENQVQCLIGPHDTQYRMENPEQALLVMRPRVPTKREASGTLLNSSKTILVTPTIRGVKKADQPEPDPSLFGSGHSGQKSCSGQPD